MSVNGKEKGAEFEGLCCRKFTQWWGRGKFIRTKNMQVVGHSERLAHGDIACVIGTSPLILDQDFPFSVECKKDETWVFETLIRGLSTEPFQAYWNQSTADAARWEKVPIVVISRNHMSEYVIYSPTRFGDQIQIVTAPSHIRTVLAGEEVVIVSLKDFFKYLTHPLKDFQQSVRV